MKKKNDKYSWDLEDLLDNKPYEVLEKDYLRENKKLVKLYEADPFKALADFRAFIKQYEKVNLLGNRIWNYLSNTYNVDLSNLEIKGLMDGLQFKLMPYSKALSNLSNTIIKNKSKIQKYLQEKDLAEYTYMYNRIFQGAPHNLSPEIEQYISNFEPLSGSYYNVFSGLVDRDFVFEDAVDSRKRRHKLNNRADLIRYLKEPDRKLRQSAYLSWQKTIFQYRETLATTLGYFYNDANISAKTRNFEGYVAATAFDDEIDPSFIQHVYTEVEKYGWMSRKYRTTFNRILKAKYKLSKVEPWDRMMSLGSSKDKYTIEDAQKMAREALAVLGKEYLANLDRAFKERWIDWKPNPNKRGGAYCIGGTKGLRKIYMLLNYNEKLDDVSTLVHEMGHALHACEYSKHQRVYASNKIFYAEIASTANEVLLSYYLLKKFANQPQKKLEIYEELLSTFFGTTSRQIIFSEFEWKANELINSGQPFNSQIAMDLYDQATKKYSPPVNDRKETEEDKQALANILTVPHFYSGVFYVYKYSIGEVAAVLTADKMFNGTQKDIDQYFQFLRAGSSLKPLEIIKLLGIDLTKSDPWVAAGKIVDGWLNEFVKLANEVYLKKPQRRPRKQAQ
ncbi:oligoendopeptidase F [Mycoplasmoides fastidiosum]|uniref:Oligopeptidase F n=1 Tax=Mycoplasmoides fastidiosum TaxID=92758 RepID=A0ABU0LY44_9BACT|nr:oligoendopeptidase F [Mycoplasmoides fastidiosum]MDQ0513602.1 oligoendopeptidase F [Mycoplasmoides fastidiosum]UUD37975.1 oligoendopeptidase F [Mycoplasmoides fastidiosum]